MVGSSRIGPNSDDDFPRDFYHGVVEGQAPKFLFLFDNTLCAKNWHSDESISLDAHGCFSVLMSHSWSVFCFNPSFLVGVVVWKAFSIQTRSLTNIAPGKMMLERLCTFLVGVRLIFKFELFKTFQGAIKGRWWSSSLPMELGKLGSLSRRARATWPPMWKK